MENLTKYFKDPNSLVKMVYKNGGFDAGGYGFLTGGFGGGIDMGEWQKLLYTQGFLNGMGRFEKGLVNSIVREVGQEILDNPDKYPLKDTDKSFITNNWL